MLTHSSIETSSFLSQTENKLLFDFDELDYRKIRDLLALMK